MLETLDMDEMDRYVDTILKNHNIIEDYEVIELKRPTIHYKRYNKKKSKQCAMQ
jgi:hypothetical protein